MKHQRRGGVRRWTVGVAALATLTGLVVGVGPVAATAAAPVKPTVTLQPATGTPGTLAHAAGTGFAPDETVTLMFDASAAGFAIADGSGAFSGVPVAVPTTATPRVHTVTALGPAGQPSAQATFTVTSPWAQGGSDVRRTGANVFENYLTSDSVARLDRAWTGVLAGRSSGGAAVARGLAIVGDDTGTLTAFRVGCGVSDAACAPRWTAHTGSAITTTPAISGARVYVASADGTVSAYPTTCRATCAPAWTATVGASPTAPAVVGRYVYVGSSDHKVYAFATRCAAACSPSWTADTGYVVVGLAVGGGHLIARTLRGLTVFDAAGCGAATCTPQWTADAFGISGAPTPLVAKGTVFIASGGLLRGYPANCGSGGAVCAPVFTADTGMGHTAGIAYAGGQLFVSDTTGLLAAYRTDCTTPCLWAWHGQVGDLAQFDGQSPIVAGDVVYYPTPEGIGAFRTTCRSDGGACTPLWTSPGGQTTFGTTESDGTLYVQTDETDGTHLLVALTPDGQAIPA